MAGRTILKTLLTLLGLLPLLPYRPAFAWLPIPGSSRDALPSDFSSDSRLSQSLRTRFLSPPSAPSLSRQQRSLGRLAESSTDGQRESIGSSSSVDKNRRQRRQWRRLQFAGVTVSPDGFRAVLRLNDTHCSLPPPVSDDVLDQSSASSPQALTLLQLLAGVDMAGPVLPPDALARIAVLSLEEEEEEADRGQRTSPKDTENDDVAPGVTAKAQVLRLVADRLRRLSGGVTGLTNAPTSYGDLLDCDPWLQARMSLPAATLDEVQLPSGILVCAFQMPSIGAGGKTTVHVRLTESACERASYQYRPNGVSRTFAALALALRYRAPIVLVEGGDDNDGSSEDSLPCPVVTLEEVRYRFPLYRTTGQLAQTTQRVTSNIETGLKVNQLQAALRKALELEDYAAATKIRAALDEMDSLKDLPTQPETDTDSMQ